MMSVQHVVVYKGVVVMLVGQAAKSFDGKLRREAV